MVIAAAGGAAAGIVALLGKKKGDNRQISADNTSGDTTERPEQPAASTT